MAPPLPTLPEIAGTLALSFTGAADAPPTPPVQRPAPVETSVPAPTTTTAPAPAPTTEPSTPSPPSLPDLPDDPAQPDESLPEPTQAAPPDPAPAPATDEDLPPLEPSTEAEPFEMPSRPAAKSPGLLAASDKRFFFDLFVGGTKAIRGYNGYFSSMDFKIEGAIGGHFRSRPNLGGAAVLQTSFGYFNTITVGPRVQWDKPIVPTHALFMHTNLLLAYRALTYGYYGLIGGFTGGAYHSALFGVGWGVRAIVADRLSLTFRPVNFSIAGPAPTIVQIDWDVFGGIGYVW